jgi:uncharacterized damage-inducible protein DinB
MTLAESMLPEFDQEMALTRICLERAPEARFEWRPHPKSPTLGWLAGFLAVLPSWATTTIRQSSLDLAPGGQTPAPPPPPRRLADVLVVFDRNVADARATLASASDEELAQPWTLLHAGKPLLTLPRAAVLRSSVLNHLVHHRAQLGVNLRLCDVPVPAIYGPSADENPWG